MQNLNACVILQSSTKEDEGDHTWEHEADQIKKEAPEFLSSETSDEVSFLSSPLCNGTDSWRIYTLSKHTKYSIKFLTMQVSSGKSAENSNYNWRPQL